MALLQVGSVCWIGILPAYCQHTVNGSCSRERWGHAGAGHAAPKFKHEVEKDHANTETNRSHLTCFFTFLNIFSHIFSVWSEIIILTRTPQACQHFPTARPRLLLLLYMLLHPGTSIPELPDILTKVYCFFFQTSLARRMKLDPSWSEPLSNDLLPQRFCHSPARRKSKTFNPDRRKPLTMRISECAFKISKKSGDMKNTIHKHS